MAGEVAEIVLMTEGLSFDDSSHERADAPIRALVARARAGDAEAFEQIMVCCQNRVISTAWRMLGNREDARDAAQEVFLRVYKYLNSFKADQDFHGWLYRIIINVCHDARRKRGRSDQLSSFEMERAPGGLESLASRDDVEAAAIRSQQQGIINRAIETLSKRERTAIVLRDLEGLPTEEVARIMGSSQATVRSQVSSARTKIKQYRDRLLNSGRPR